MRALKVTRVAVVVGTLTASGLMAAGAYAAPAGDGEDRYEGRERSSSSYEEYEEREEFVSERHGHGYRHGHDHGRSEKKMRDYWEERDRDDHGSPRWHFADPRGGDFDFHREHDRDRRHDRDHGRGARAGDGGDGGS